MSFDLLLTYRAKRASAIASEAVGRAKALQSSLAATARSGLSNAIQFALAAKDLKVVDWSGSKRYPVLCDASSCLIAFAPGLVLRNALGSFSCLECVHERVV